MPRKPLPQPARVIPFTPPRPLPSTPPLPGSSVSSARIQAISANLARIAMRRPVSFDVIELYVQKTANRCLEGGGR